MDRGHLNSYLTLDDFSVREAVASDPEGFLAALDTPAVIDEVQLEPKLFRAIKSSVDRDRTPGRFLLTGSADLSVMPKAAEALVGRMETLTLWPLSQGEIRGTRELFVDALFDPAWSWRSPPQVSRDSLARIVCAGGYPEPLQRDHDDREPWHRAYVDLVVRRDIAERSDIAGLASIPRLLALLSARTMTLANTSEIGRSMELPATTLRRYVSLLEAAMLVRMIPAWSRNVARRMVKSPKIAVVDTGLASTVAGFTRASLTGDPTQFGRLTETFVANEVQKQLGWSRTSCRLMHARTVAGREIDIVLEASDGRVAGIEVKVGRSAGAADFAGLKALREATRDRFTCGVVLHSGESVVPFASNLFALPVATLWDV
jgi:hypothetical protein